MKVRRVASLVLVPFVATFSGCGKKETPSQESTSATPTPAVQAEPPDVRLAKFGYKLQPSDFVIAAGNGEVEAVGLFLDAGIDPNSQDADGATALIRSAEMGHIAVAKLLLERGAEPDRPGRESWTALMAAAYYNRPDVVTVLLAKGASPALKDVNGWSALFKAVHQGHVESVKLIAPASKDQLDRALMLAALIGKAKVVEALLDAGANVNTKIEKDQTALMFAAMKGQMEAVRVLLARGADPLAINADGSTASILALEKGFVDVSKVIDDSVADRPAIDPNATPAPAVSATPAMAETPAVLPTDSPTPEAAVSASPAAPAETPAQDPNTAVSTTNTAPAMPENPAGTPPSNADAFATWAAQNKLDAAAPDVATGDPDADGFNNTEEFQAGTDPNDAEAHPTRLAKLKMIAFKGEQVPLVLQTISGKQATLRRTDSGETMTVSSGQRVQGFPYKVTRIREKATTDKTGQTIDVSEVTLVNVNSGSKVVLLPDLPARSPESHAVLQVAGLGEKINVKQDQEFSLPGDRSTKLKVLDLRPTEVILQETGSGQVVTIALQENP